MNTSEIILFVVIVSFVSIQNTSPVKSGDKDYNLFHDNTKSLHIAMNKLFTILKLNKAFKQAPKMQLLLSMHNNFINIIENNNKDNDEMKNITDNIPIKDWFNLNDVMKEISLHNLIRKHSQSGNKTNINKLNTIISVVIVNCLKDFLVKIENVKQNVMDTFLTSNIDKNKYVTPAMKKVRKSAPDLKIWLPEANNSHINEHRKMFRSKKTKVRKFPFIASVHLHGKFICAGSIVRKDLVLTSASCLQMSPEDRLNVKSLTHILVRVGSDYTESGGQLLSICNVFFHPFYDSKTLRNNLVLLRLVKKLRFTKKQMIRRIRFDRTGDFLKPHQREITMLGWGARDETNIPYEFQKISYSNLNIYDLNDCRDVFSTLYVTDSNFCAGFVSKAGGACKRDVGDAAIVATTLVGIVSFGPPMCGTPDVPTVFTKISLYAAWIDSVADAVIGDLNDLNAPQVNDGTLERSTTKFDWLKLTEEPLDYKNIDLNYPDEVLLIREMLNDIVASNTSLLEDFVDENINKEIMQTFKIKNRMKKVKRIGPGANTPSEISSSHESSKLIAANNSKYLKDYFNYDDISQVFKSKNKNKASRTTGLMYTNNVVKPTYPMASEFIGTDMNERTYKKDKKIISDDFSGNYEDGDEIGLSIEYNSAKLQANDKYAEASTDDNITLLIGKKTWRFSTRPNPPFEDHTTDLKQAHDEHYTSARFDVINKYSDRLIAQWHAKIKNNNSQVSALSGLHPSLLSKFSPLRQNRDGAEIEQNKGPINVNSVLSQINEDIPLENESLDENSYYIESSEDKTETTSVRIELTKPRAQDQEYSTEDNDYFQANSNEKSR